MNAYRSHDRRALSASQMHLGCIAAVPSGFKNLENGDGVVILINPVDSIQIRKLRQFYFNFKHGPILTAISKPPTMRN